MNHHQTLKSRMLENFTLFIVTVCWCWSELQNQARACVVNRTCTRCFKIKTLVSCPIQSISFTHKE